MKFTTYNSPQYVLNIGYNGKYIEETVNTKFLGLQIDSHLSWSNHIDKLIPKLSGACMTDCKQPTGLSSIGHSSCSSIIRVHCHYSSDVSAYRYIFWHNRFLNDHSHQGHVLTPEKHFNIMKYICLLASYHI
jgi:hypothetical protein